MSGWLRPSLLRRIVFTLMATLVLVWAVLSLKDYRDFKRDVQERESLARMAQTVLDSLSGLDVHQARGAMKAADRQFNALRLHAQPEAPGTLLFQLSHADGGGGLVYRSGEADDLPDLAADPNAMQLEHKETSYWPVMRENAHWRLAVWVPVLPDRVALLMIGEDMFSYVLLALPFVVLPMIMAVWLGLRPLRALTQQIARRRTDDLSPLQEPTGYAELAPLVEAGNALLARARHQREAEQTFVQDAAHELKTPLAVVAAQAHVLASAQRQDERRAALQALEQGVNRASHQVNQLLALAGLDHAAPSPVHPVDLVEMVQETLVELEPIARRRNVALTLQSSDRLMDRVDTNALRLVLVNLVRNAIEHGREGGLVEVNLGRNGAVITLRVSDDGPGVAQGDRGRLFDRFYRASPSATSGSGLGLAIVQSAARRLKARVVCADGRGGKGLSFSVQWQVQFKA